MKQLTSWLKRFIKGDPAWLITGWDISANRTVTLMWPSDELRTEEQVRERMELLDLGIVRYRISRDLGLPGNKETYND